jgi:choline dehydrogenase
MGVEPIIDLPGVGENLVDQPNTPIMFHVDNGLHGGSPFVSFATAADLFGSSLGAIGAETRRNLGRWAQQVANSNPAGPSRAKAFERIFQIQHDLIFRKRVTISEIFTTAFAGTVVSTPATLLPFSRGSIHKAASNTTTDPDLPAIDPKYLAINLDMTTQVAAGRLAAVLSNTSPLSELARSTLLPPGGDCNEPPPAINASNAQWERWTADAMSSNWHSMGTAAMMSRDLGGVVDADLNVYETQGLRVVDASILPMPFSGHPMAILYAVAEKAAEIIRRSRTPMVTLASGGEDQIVMR